jgi:hypothetical protein
MKSLGDNAHNTKTNVIVDVVARIIVVAIGRTTVPWIVVPGAAPQLLELPAPILTLLAVEGVW